MTWLNPSAFFFLALIPVIIVLHALRYRRRDVQVSTLFLWESVLRETHGTLGLRRFIHNLPLLLQIVLVLLLTVVLARPALTTAISDAKDLVLVLDVSASMQTRPRTGNGNRFRQAKARALNILQNLPNDRQMAVITAGRQPRVLSYFTNEKALLHQAISEAQVSNAPGNMRDAVLLALSFSQGKHSQEVVMIGDGAYNSLSDLDLPRGQIRHIRIAGGSNNLGITRLAIRKRLDSDTHHEVFVAVKNFSQQPMTTPVRLTLRRRQLLNQQLSLQPGQEERLITTLDRPPQGVVKAELLTDDDFSLDNLAHSVIANKSTTWILLVGESNYFLERLLTSMPGVLVNVSPDVPAEALPRLLEVNHLIIFNGVQPPPLQSGNFLLINTIPPDERYQSSGQVLNPQVLDWRRQHPVLRYVDVANLHIEEALAIRLQGEAQSLIDGTNTSLLSVIERPRLRLATLAFDPMRSDLPLRVAFPVLMHNLLRWLSPGQGGVTGSQLQAGMPYSVFFEQPVQRVAVQDPEGKQRTYEVQGNPWLFSDTERLGVYILRAGEQKHYLTVNLLDAMESDINPSDAFPSLVPDASQPTQHTGLIETPLWPFVLLGATAMLLGEWYVWSRDF